jgi:hypothetical protein
MEFDFTPRSIAPSGLFNRNSLIDLTSTKYFEFISNSVIIKSMDS